MMIRMDSRTSTSPAGWYDDGRGQLRWWDGEQWTEHTAPLARQAASGTGQSPTAPAQPQQVGRSKLVWLLPTAIAAAAVIGGLLGAVAAATFSDTDPLERTYAAYAAAELTGDCAALEQITTSDFRDELTEDLTPSFACDAWRLTLGGRQGTVKWALRVGPAGILVADEQYQSSVGTEPVGSVTYVMVHEGGRWRIDDRDDSASD